MGPEMAIAVVVTFAFLALAMWLIGSTSYHAYRRGYQPIVWALAAIIALNPVFLLVVLAIVPHRRRLRMRERFASELDEKLDNVRAPRTGPEFEGSRTETRSAELRIEPNAGQPMDLTQTFPKK